MARTSQKCLQSLTGLVNKAAGITRTEWERRENRNIAPVGAYLLGHSNGGYALHHVESEAGAVEEVIPRSTASEMEMQLRAFLKGMNAALQRVTPRA